MMPPKAAPLRAEQLAWLSTTSHSMMVDEKMGEVLAAAEAEGADDGGDVEVAELDELQDSSQSLSAEEKRKLDTILDIPVTISMEVGRSKINIRNLLQLNQGSVVELDGDEIRLAAH